MAGGVGGAEGTAVRGRTGAGARKEGWREERKRARATGVKEGKDGERARKREKEGSGEQEEESEVHLLGPVPCGILTVSGCSRSGYAWLSCGIPAPFCPLRAYVQNVGLHRSPAQSVALPLCGFFGCVRWMLSESLRAFLCDGVSGVSLLDAFVFFFCLCLR